MFNTKKMTCIRGEIHDRLHIVASNEVMESIIHVVYALYMLCCSVTSPSFRQFNISGMSAKWKGRLQTGGLQEYTVQCTAGKGPLKVIMWCHSWFHWLCGLWGKLWQTLRIRIGSPELNQELNRQFLNWFRWTTSNMLNCNTCDLFLWVNNHRSICVQKKLEVTCQYMLDNYQVTVSHKFKYFERLQSL